VNCDQGQLTNLLADVCPVDDENSNETGDNGGAKFPLTEDHWINAPLGKEHRQVFQMVKHAHYTNILMGCCAVTQS
jgi:hypothetical protein